MQYLSVFCGAKLGSNPKFNQLASELGKAMVAHNFGLVYGGASIGIMGQIANSVLDAGGQAIGVIPHSMLNKEVAHPNLTQLHIVESMHERKQKMADLSHGVIALPGGYGTLDELFEALTWYQLKIQQLPCSVINCDGYFDHLIAFLDRAVKDGLLKAEHREFFWVETDINILLRRFSQYKQH